MSHPCCDKSRDKDRGELLYLKVGGTSRHAWYIEIEGNSGYEMAEIMFCPWCGVRLEEPKV